MAVIVELVPNPLLGTWQSCDGLSDVEFSIAYDEGELLVSGRDNSDGEVASISNVSWSAAEQRLCFDAYWPSSGQLTRYRLIRAPRNGRVMVTYTLTAQDTWERV
ncbi:hypothetical protein [Methylomagnum ishizawai]|uniref:hypothetical protein n=1 Tax=Methylomagnum ishizawai TaxID=1760988 RepID=UPI001C32FDC1|nr:hypothetical protein [Methylomagnum ishizawai]BBL74459.1 hypothetical protein MishRS11D_15570 [Methylomagnum ishizawai]